MKKPTAPLTEPTAQHLSILRTLQSFGPSSRHFMELHTGIEPNPMKHRVSQLLAHSMVAFDQLPCKTDPTVYAITDDGRALLELHANADDVWSLPRRAFPRVASVWELGGPNQRAAAA